MGLMRPGTKIPFWNPKHTNRPDIGPPVLLRVLSGYAILSVVGSITFATFETLLSLGYSPPDSNFALYVAFLHFLLPIGIAYTISTNSPLSRPLSALYFLVLLLATANGAGALALLFSDENVRVLVSITLLLLILGWLYLGPKTRTYYLLIAGRDIPESLARYENTLREDSWISPKLRHALDWALDHLETVILVAFILVVIVVFVTT